MNPKSSIEKGKRLEKFVIHQLSEYQIDINARRESGSGNGLKKGDIFSTLDFLAECKNQKTIHFLKDVDQAKGQAKIGYHNPDKWLLITRDFRSAEFNDVYVTLDLHEFLKLYKKSMQPKTENPDKNFRYTLDNLNRAIKQVNKYLPTNL